MMGKIGRLTSANYALERANGNWTQFLQMLADYPVVVESLPKELIEDISTRLMVIERASFDACCLIDHAFNIIAALDPGDATIHETENGIY